MSGIRDTIIGPTRSVLDMILRQYTCILEYLSSFPLSFSLLSSSFPYTDLFLYLNKYNTKVGPPKNKSLIS